MTGVTTLPADVPAATSVVGLVGLGVMGTAMLQRFSDCGVIVVATTRSLANRDAVVRIAGIQVVDEPAQVAAVVAAQCSGDVVVLVSLPAGPQVAAVVADLLPGVPPGRRLLVIDTSTCDPADARALASRLDAVGHALLDAPVSGGPTGARNGTLSIMVGGPTSVLTLVTSLLSYLAGRIVHCGPSGAGQVVKAANQLVVACTVEAVAEAFTLAAGHGIQPETVREALMGGYAASRVLELQGARMVSGDFVPGGTAALLAKDVGIIRDLAGGTGLRLPAFEATAMQVATLSEQSPDLDHSALITLLDGGVPR